MPAQTASFNNLATNSRHRPDHEKIAVSAHHGTGYTSCFGYVSMRFHVFSLTMDRNGNGRLYPFIHYLQFFLRGMT